MTDNADKTQKKLEQFFQKSDTLDEKLTKIEESKHTDKRHQNEPCKPQVTNQT